MMATRAESAATSAPLAATISGCGLSGGCCCASGVSCRGAGGRRSWLTPRLLCGCCNHEGAQPTLLSSPSPLAADKPSGTAEQEAAKPHSASPAAAKNPVDLFASADQELTRRIIASGSASGFAKCLPENMTFFTDPLSGSAADGLLHNNKGLPISANVSSVPCRSVYE